MALIELSPETPAPPAAATPPPAYVYRRAGLLLAVLLLLALGGSAPASSLIWRRTGVVPLPESGDFQLFGGRLYTVDYGSAPPRIRALTTDPVRELWSVPGPPGNQEQPYFITDASAGLVMVRTGRATTVLDAGTGQQRWRTPHLVQRLGGDTGLVQEERFRPGTEYDPESGEPGRLYGSTSDILHTEPALSTSLSAVDMTTGRRLWSAVMPGSVSAQWLGPEHEMVAVLSADHLTLRSGSTGAVVREQTVPRIGGRAPAWFEPIGDVLLVHYGDFAEGGRVAAYAQDTLDLLWQRDEPDTQGSSVTCAGLPCANSRTDLALLDPRTGAPLWRAAPGNDLAALGAGAVLESRNSSRPLRIADRGTGRTITDLRYWMTYTSSPRADAYLLTRFEAATSSTVTGILRPGATAVQPLGRIPQTTGECRADTAAVACRVPGGVGIYRHLG
ncbi:PQQ-binding-like beta-propeller repeat protein [Actinoplanes sp. NPDC049681]|uniref:outer membrane protein assembly factor BamB family protein n=1 Tax=Actinoplanes sp. NPDC049681 TaxID=3363905 RepID=UPI0037ABE305